MCLDCCAMNRGIEAQVMFVSRGLPTCKMLIRKNVYSFMMYIHPVAKSGNAVLQSIMNSDALYTSPLRHYWRNMLYTVYL